MSYSEVARLISSLIYSTLPLIDSFSPAPSIMIVSSLLIITFLALPRIVTSQFSKDIPRSVSRTSDLVNTPISSNWFFLLFPKPGVFTQTTLKTPFNLLRIKAANGSDSTSSAMITKGLFD